jgi:hypothetical protein
MRAITGGWFGVGLGAVLFPYINDLDASPIVKQAKIFGHSLRINTIRVVLASFVLILGGYFVFVQLWNISSVNVKPSNLLDSAIKAPPGGSSIIERRATGICPVKLEPSSSNISEIFAFDCFLRGKDAKSQ